MRTRRVVVPDRSSPLPPSGRSRRAALARVASAAALLVIRRSPLAAAAHGARQDDPFAPPTPQETANRVPPPTSADEDALDAALARLQASDAHEPGGLSTHAPMAAEALSELGGGGAIAGWIGRFTERARVIELPRPRERIVAAQWRAHVGLAEPAAADWERANARYGDWRLLFTDELRERGWRETLLIWAPRLAPGYCAAAMHGVIRTAHAARALARRESTPRFAELVRGLAYWASAYQELGSNDLRAAVVPALPASLAASLAALPLHREQQGDAPRGNFVDGLRAAAALPGFPPATPIAELAGNVAHAITRMTAAMARAYLRHGTRARPLAFVHAVTGPAALRKLASVLPAEIVAPLVPFAWQAAEGLYAAYAFPDHEAAPLAIAATGTPATIAANAAAASDVHVIKFTEALLAENAIGADPAYLAAAEDLPLRL